MNRTSLHTPVHIVNVRRHPRCLTFLLLIFLAPTMIMAQGKWIANTSARVTQGSYYFEQTTSTFALIPGVRYETPDWSFDISIPYLIQNSDLVSNTGSMFFPTGEGHHQQPEGRESSHHGGRMNPGSQSWDSGMGDMLIYAGKNLLREADNLPAIALTVQVKLPTADRGLNYGTGEIDYGAGISLSKKYGTLAAFFDLGYLIIGDPEGASYLDPIMTGAGIGKFFQHGKYSLLLYYQTYGKIIEELDPPRQISAQMMMRFKNDRFFTLSLLSGLSETSPDFSLSLGLQQNL